MLVAWRSTLQLWEVAKFASGIYLPPDQLSLLPNGPINTESVFQSIENVWRLKAFKTQGINYKDRNASNRAPFWFYVKSLGGRCTKQCVMIQSLLWPTFKAWEMLAAPQDFPEAGAPRWMISFLSRKERGSSALHLVSTSILCLFQALWFNL